MVVVETAVVEIEHPYLPRKAAGGGPRPIEGVVEGESPSVPTQ